MSGLFVAYATCVFLGMLVKKNKIKSPGLKFRPGQFILIESGLSLKGCSPAEPFSVSPDDNKSKGCKLKRKY